MSWIKKLTKIFAYSLYLFIAVVAMLEVIFRALPTTTPIGLQPVTSADDILRFEANRTATFSLGANYYKTVTKKTNNAGFYSNYNYEKFKSPKILIVGDSYVEAAQIDNADTMGEVMRAKYGQKDVYQMGVAGVPLSQYIKMAEYAENNYAPDELVIVIVGNDFDQSLCDYRVKLGTWCFDNNYELTFIPFQGYAGLRKYGRQSAFARYLFLQAGINWRGVMSAMKLKPQGMEAQSMYAGNVKRFKTVEIIEKSYIVIDRFFEELNKLQINDKVTLVLDADRQDIYNNRQTESFFQTMRDYTIDKANENGVRLIDMRFRFEDDYKKNNIKFEFPTDGHWNERAHALVAAALMEN